MAALFFCYVWYTYCFKKYAGSNNVYSVDIVVYCSIVVLFLDAMYVIFTKDIDNLFAIYICVVYS